MDQEGRIIDEDQAIFRQVLILPVAEIVKDVSVGADRECWKQKGISAAAYALVNLSESTSKER